MTERERERRVRERHLGVFFCEGRGLVVQFRPCVGGEDEGRDGDRLPWWPDVHAKGGESGESKP